MEGGGLGGRDPKMDYVLVAWSLRPQNSPFLEKTEKWVDSTVCISVELAA